MCGTGGCRFLILTCPFSVLSGFQESIVGNCMDRSSPGQAMQVPDHNGLGYPVRPSSSEHPRPRSLQRHHTIQNSDDAYVGASACQVPALKQPGLPGATQGSADATSPAGKELVRVAQTSVLCALWGLGCWGMSCPNLDVGFATAPFCCR